jgi:hypothetical protein
VNDQGEETMQDLQKNESRGFGKKHALALGGVSGISLLALGCVDGPLGLLLSLLLVFMGATPAPDFGQTGRVDFNLLSQNEIADDPGLGLGEGADDSEVDEEEAPSNDEGGKVDPNVEYVIEVDEPADTDARILGVDVKEAQEQGTFAILLDSSGSMELSFQDVCPTCPHDPERKRVQAAQILSKEVLSRTPDSRLAVFDWGTDEDEVYDGINTLANFTSDSDILIDGASKTGSLGATFIYDALADMLELMSNDIAQNFQAKPVTKGIIVMTDGQDTASGRTLNEIIEKAQNLEIPIHVVGLGPANEKFNEIFQGTEDNSASIKDLRRLAGETGGFYASVDSAEGLTQLAEFIAIGLAGGYTTTQVVLDPIPASGTIVKGTIFVVDPETGEKVEPGEPWEFVAP